MTNIEMLEVETAELTGNQLRWATGLALGLDIRNTGNTVWVKGKVPNTDSSDDYYDPLCWSQGGPLLDELMKTGKWVIVQGINAGDVYVQNYDTECCPVDGISWEDDSIAISSESILVAVCRVIVASKLGNVVNVPAMLVGVAN